MAKLPLLGDSKNIGEAGLAGLDHNFLTGKIEELVKRSRDRSMWPATFALSC